MKEVLIAEKQDSAVALSMYIWLNGIKKSMVIKVTVAILSLPGPEVIGSIRLCRKLMTKIC